MLKTTSEPNRGAPSALGAGMGGGVSEACGYNDHDQCRAKGCGCDCHSNKRDREAASSRSSLGDRGSGAAAGMAGLGSAGLGEKACPKCSQLYPETRNFCTVDGVRLSSLRCGECGLIAAPEDNYCGECGFPIKRVRVEDESERALEQQPQQPDPLQSQQPPQLVEGMFK